MSKIFDYILKHVEARPNNLAIHEICTGKTGTLTKNDMRVQQFYASQGNVTVRDSQHLQSANLPNNVVETIRDCIIYNCGSRVELDDVIPTENRIEG